MKTLFCALILAAVATAAKADPVTITFDQPNQIAGAGQTLEFFGTITNNTASTIFLNSDDPNLAGLSFSINDQFFSTVPPSLAAGANSGDIELFDVTLSNPLQDAFATYAGDYTLVGGIDGNAQDNIGSAAFSVSSVPEPSTIGLLFTGFAGLLPIRSRLRRRA
jgi:hypothetical protein